MKGPADDMVIRKYHSLRWWIALAVTLMFVGIALPLGLGIWYTQSQIRHECTALDILIALPVQPHTDKNVEFHNALVQWHDQDGC